VFLNLIIIIINAYLLQLSFNSVAVVLTLVQTKQIRGYEGIKMAVVVSSSETKAPSISDLTIVNSDFKCICCQHLQQELETALLGIKTAKKNYRISTKREKLYCIEHHWKHTR
jgi:hypothetical protein